ncbi:hypothetical protein L2827_00880 [Lactobacillus gasseri]|uniref:hypothetical protein n=1 Tax=Lactobacillus TaxID=1578 RepID=UPI0002FAE449|nr:MULTISPECIES: hypothetical protein [Lactobacillus]MCZ3537270.1 hypothetical protein [Lactobacillus gasseri]KDA99156.1 hypothetical protein LK7_003755 [Lactobacillus paragasseri K7]MBO3729643.1 hypothetical protein [Lactobacillus paragasseri]MBV6739530.1 hypothetical protein [Lactobacillus gasseri CECT 5714]MCZ3538939.1 hypothetical protein [Lactobacillus gasseri]
MSEIENIKDGLNYLLELNSLENTVSVTENGKAHPMSVKDLKEANIDGLFQIAELLGINTDN